VGRQDRFRTAVEAASARYLELADWEALPGHLAREDDLDGDEQGGRRSVALAPSLAAAQPALVARFADAGFEVIVPDGDDPAAEVADVAVAVVRAELAIAETGSVLVAEHALGDRVVTMLCRRLVQVVEADMIADRLEAAAEWLRERGGQPGFASLMTGPSRTADIERSLTIGVQGPDEVDVVVLTATPGGAEGT
jgi:L-lactate dehydrogenase complex protein LldG